MKTKERATSQVRVYPSTVKRLKLRAIQLGVPFADLVDKISKKV